MRSRLLISSAALMVLFTAQSPALAQSEESPQYGWQKDLVAALNLTQTSFDNWAQGGENSLAWQAGVNFKFTNEQKRSTWTNSGKLVYGETKTGNLESRKSIDEIKVESVFAHKISKYWNLFGAATGETQFAPGYDYGADQKTQISAFMDPGYFRESAGIGYTPNEIVKTRLGVSVKETITDKYTSLYAGEGEDKIRIEIGAESVTDVSWNVSENTLLTSKLELFAGSETLNKTDVSWDNSLTFKISKFVNVNFNTKIYYDKDISKKRQLKQSLAIGLTYSFF